jgi:TPP-dependent pyruvate/acetoin dehydrogenase alpha subunit
VDEVRKTRYATLFLLLAVYVKVSHMCVCVYASDPLDLVKRRLIDNDWATAADIKALEKEVRSEVATALKEAKASPPPAPEELISDILYKEELSFVRGFHEMPVV